MTLLKLLLALLITTPAWAGVDFSGRIHGIPPPEFANTEEAEAYGQANKDNIPALVGLHEEKERADKEFLSMTREERNADFNRAYRIALRTQFCDEALAASGHVGATMYAGSHIVRRQNVQTHDEMVETPEGR